MQDARPACRAVRRSLGVPGRARFRRRDDRGHRHRRLSGQGFPDDDPYLDQDTVFGVRGDLVMRDSRKAAASFPIEGYARSGRVQEDYRRVDCDLVLARER